MSQKIDVKVNKKTFDFVKDSESRHTVLWGGAGSGKSWSIAQMLLLDKMAKMDNIRIVVTMTTRPQLKKAAWLLMRGLIDKYDLPVTYNLSDLVIRLGSNEMYFVPCDDAKKFESFEKINYIWVEEAIHIKKKDYLQLNLRCRGANEKGINQLFYSFNPEDEQSYWKEIIEQPLDEMVVQHSTWKDNAFLSDAYVKTLENLIKQDEVFHKIYTLGLWATPTALIYTNWEITEAAPAKYEERIWGLDFGYSSSQTALIEIRFLGGNKVWEREHIYETGLTNPELITKLEGIVEKDDMIIADAAEPKAIQEIKNSGFNIHPSAKGKDSVLYGINTVKSYTTLLDADSPNLIKEKRSYKWKEDKDGNVLEKPVKFRDHLVDAERGVLAKIRNQIKPDVSFIDFGSDGSEEDEWDDF